MSKIVGVFLMLLGFLLGVLLSFLIFTSGAFAAEVPCIKEEAVSARVIELNKDLGEIAKAILDSERAALFMERYNAFGEQTAYQADRIVGFSASVASTVLVFGFFEGCLTFDDNIPLAIFIQLINPTADPDPSISLEKPEI